MKSTAALLSAGLLLLQLWLGHGLLSLPPLSLNMSVNIFLIQDQDSGGSGSEFNSLRLSSVLNKLLSKSTLPSPSPHPPPDHSVEFSYQFSVTPLPALHYQNYRSLILNSDQVSNETHLLSSAMLDSYLSSLHSSLSNPSTPSTVASFTTLPIFIVSPTKALPPHKLFSSSPSLCSQTYSGDSLFVDFSASLCDYSHLIGALNHHHSGIATHTVLHDIYPPTSSTDPNNPSNVFLTASLAHVVGSAIESFTLLNDLKPRVSFSSQRIVTPIVFLKSRYAALEKEGKPQPGLSIGELKLLQNRIQSLLLPSQTISLLTSTHYLEDHPQLTIAMAAASRWTVATSDAQSRQEHLQIPYLDSRSLLSELSQIGDNLCRRLLVDAGHGLEDDSLLQIEALFQSIEMKGERLSKDEKIIPDWIRHYTPTDDYDASPHGPTRHRTQILPIFVISDLETTGFELMEDSDPIDRNGIFPLFEDGRSVSSLESVGLVLHSREPNLTVYSKAMYGGLRKGINLSDASLSIAEILTKIVTGIRPPFEVSDDGHRDLTWTVGTHPFAPYGHLGQFSNVPPQNQRSGLSQVYGSASMRGIMMTRATEILSEYLALLHSAEAFSHDLSRLYQIIIHPIMRLLPTTTTWKNSNAVIHRVNPFSHTAKSDLLEATFSSLSFLQYIDVSQKIPNSEDLYVIPPEQRHMLQELRTIVDEIAEEVLSLYRMMNVQPPATRPASSSDQLLSYLETIEKCEENLQILRWNYFTSENRLKQHLDLCQLETSSPSQRSASNSPTSKYLIAGIGFVSVTGLFFFFKFVQGSLEAQAKKTK